MHSTLYIRNLCTEVTRGNVLYVCNFHNICSKLQYSNIIFLMLKIIKFKLTQTNTVLPLAKVTFFRSFGFSLCFVKFKRIFLFCYSTPVQEVMVVVRGFHLPVLVSKTSELHRLLSVTELRVLAIISPTSSVSGQELQTIATNGIRQPARL